MAESNADEIRIRPAEAGDLAAVVAIDEDNTGLAKPRYWEDVFARYVRARRKRRQRLFLVAERGGEVLGFIVGEVRAWEFGSPPCGWIFAIHVRPEEREHRIGSRLLDAACARFRRAGVATVRTMISRRDALNLAFFRSQGMAAGPYIELEKAIE